ncbi:MAG: hypothetical protein IKL79_06135 [Clostridia bacterium]|nr:hypothetical protein [Clostridia bacterium]MBR3681565.1 hypothetical protein [Clostridia bacterium]
MSEDIFRLARELSADITDKYPNRFFPVRLFESTLQKYFEDEARHGTVFIPSRHDGSLYFNASAFARGLKIIFDGCEKGAAKTITATMVEHNFTLYIKVDGKLASRQDMAVAARIMHMAGFKLSCDESTVQLIGKLAEMNIYSLYNTDINELQSAMMYEFYDT